MAIFTFMKSKIVNSKNKYNRKIVYAVRKPNTFIAYPFDDLKIATVFCDQSRFNRDSIIKFDSKLERDRYLVLLTMERDGIISDLEMQVPFVLIPRIEYIERAISVGGGFKTAKRTNRETKYIADFTYTYLGEKIVEDTKSPITRKKSDFSIKKKLMQKEHGLCIKIVESKDLKRL